MSNVENFIRATLQRVSGISGVFIGFIEYYLNYVNELNYESEPDYSKIHRKITETLEYLGHSKAAIDSFHIVEPSKLPPSTLTIESDQLLKVNQSNNESVELKV